MINRLMRIPPVLAVLLLAGCAGMSYENHSIAVGPEANAVGLPGGSESVPIIQSLRPQDILDVIFHIDMASSEAYRVQAGDDLEFRFQTAPDFNGRQAVLPDGSVVLPEVGSVTVAGRTLVEVRDHVSDLYRKVLKDPDVVVTAPTTQAALQSLRSTLLHPAYGYSREISVRADGYGTFPLVGELALAGRSIPEVTQALNERYAAIDSRVRVDVLLKRSAPSQLFVIGEVGQPGAFPIYRPMSVLEALALANGARSTARLDSVVIVRRRADKATMTVYDLNAALADGSNPSLAYLQPDDLLFVPKTRLAHSSEVMRQLAGTFLFNGIGYTFSYRVDDKGDYSNELRGLQTQ